MDENPTLSEGASFGDIADLETVPADGEQPTPQTVEGEQGATEGSQPEPEIPAAFKDAPAPEGEAKPDLNLDADLEGHPVLKAKWLAYKAEKEKGIDKFIQENNEKVKTLEAKQVTEEHEALTGIWELFKNPTTVDEALGQLYGMLNDAYAGSRTFGQTQTETTTEGGEPKSKYGFEFPSDDKVVDTAANLILPQIEKLLNDRLGPVSEDFNARKAEQEMGGKADAALPSLKSTFEVSSDSWITKEMVVEAMREFPTVSPDAAFKAKYAVEIGKYYAKHSGGQSVRQLPKNDSGGKTIHDLSEGASFGDIVASEATL